jgi:hypothetical protein
MDEYDSFYRAFKEHVHKDSGEHNIGIINKYVVPELFKPREEKDIDELRELFTKIKAEAVARDETLKRFLDLWKVIFDDEPEDSFQDDNSGIDWANVLLYGHEDGSFEDFLSDHGKIKQKLSGRRS